jgi:hypothetical protein
LRHVRRPAPTEIVLLSYTNDEDMLGLSRMLSRRGVSNAVWDFEARDHDLEIDAASGRFTLRRSGRSMSSETLAGARVLIHRPGIRRWRRPVAAKRGSPSERVGLCVADLRVSTAGLLPNSATDEYVAKAINEDENIDAQCVYCTASLDKELVSGGDFRTDTPP